MPILLTKLNLKSQQDILVLNSPDTFEKEIESLHGTRVHRKLDGLQSFKFALAFATQRAEVARLSKALAAKADGDALLWFA